MSKKKQRLEIPALRVAGGETIKSAAESVGCSVSYAYSLSRTDEFRDKVAELRSDLTDQAVGRLAEQAAQATNTLAEMLGTEHEPAVRLRAARSILAHLLPLQEGLELRRRLEAIERRQSEGITR